MLTDTHCHLLKSDYDNLEDIINNLASNNIKRIIINGYNYETNLEVLALVEKYSHVYGALGIHPDNLDEGIEDSLALIEGNLDNNKIIAIGEIGLDYYHNKANCDEQKETFVKFLEMAQKYQKPVIIHNRQATEDMLKILRQYKLKGVIHCFAEDYAIAINFIKLGFKLGINGIVTFNNSALPTTLKQLDMHHILLETDCPYLTPAPFRKYRNEPKYLNNISKKIAEIYNVEEEKLTEVLEKNFHDTFDI